MVYCYAKKYTLTMFNSLFFVFLLVNGCISYFLTIRQPELFYNILPAEIFAQRNIRLVKLSLE